MYVHMFVHMQIKEKTAPNHCEQYFSKEMHERCLDSKKKKKTNCPTAALVIKIEHSVNTYAVLMKFLQNPHRYQFIFLAFL